MRGMAMIGGIANGGDVPPAREAVIMAGEAHPSAGCVAVLVRRLEEEEDLTGTEGAPGHRLDGTAAEGAVRGVVPVPQSLPLGTGRSRARRMGKKAAMVRKKRSYLREWWT